MTWQWNKQFIPIRKLTDAQLLSIQETLEKTQRSKWFGYPTKEWSIAIGKTLGLRARRELVDQMYKRRVNKAFNTVDKLVPIFQKLITNNKQ